MEVVKKPLLRTLTEQDFQNTETAIDMRKDLSFSSKNSYKSILSNLKERIHKYTLQNVELKTDETVSWKNLKRCIFREEISKNVMICRNKSPLIKTTHLTPQACKLCDQVTEEMIQLEQITGVKPRFRTYKALKIMKEKYALKNDEIQTISKDRDFYKHELEENRLQMHGRIQSLQNELSTLGSEEENFLAEKHKVQAMKERLETREKSLDKETEKRVEQGIQQKKKEFTALTLVCPETGQRVPIADKCYYCPKNMECSEYAKLLCPPS